jgi:hypothetical protein
MVAVAPRCSVLTILSLLRSGGDFDASHVARLKDQCAVIPHERFVCFSDVEVPCERIVLKHDWRRWWGQLELFSVVFDGPVLYFDLDTTVLKDPQIPIERGDFWSLAWPRKGVRQPTSGVMAWWGDFSSIYYDALGESMDPDRWVNEAIFKNIQPKIIQDHVPGFYSYKRQVRHRGVPDDARIIFWHGRPRPWNLPELVAA